MKSGSWFAIETLMSVAAIGALFIGDGGGGNGIAAVPHRRALGRMGRQPRPCGVSALMALKPENGDPSARRRTGRGRY